tara:strand:- start:2703 stop:4097 length:1395 start_codon:yes stop_codon:yes gene_type:complete
MIDLKISKNFFVLGLGISGLSTALFLKKFSKTIFCWDDDKEKRELAADEKLLVKKFDSIDNSQIDYLVVSPIINHRLPNKHPAVEKAKKMNIKIISDLEILNIYKLPNYKIGITGTNGKSTTTKFIEKSLLSQKIRVIACGNIGLPVTEIIPKLKKNNVLAIEASSFQLDKIDTLKFDISILLNLNNDHIDWHKSFDKYKKAKLRIFENQNKNDYAVICIDDKETKRISENFEKKFNSSLIKISTEKRVDDGIFLEDSKNGIKIYNNLNSEKIFIKKRVFNFTKVKHNFQNLLATYTVNFLLQKKAEKFQESIKEIVNLEHRIEFVNRFKNISFYNDSKATNLESTKNAISSFPNIYWILGGRKKRNGLKGIDNYLGNIIHAFCYGECREEFHNYLKKKSIKTLIFEDMKSAVKNAFKKSLKEKNKINILLSPACSSFDQFANFEDRGNKFKILVNNIIKNEKK